MWAECDKTPYLGRACRRTDEHRADAVRNDPKGEVWKSLAGVLQRRVQIPFGPVIDGRRVAAKARGARGRDTTVVEREYRYASTG